MNGKSQPTILNVSDGTGAFSEKTRILQRANYNVLEARTGKAALTVVRAAVPEVVVLDGNLPDLHGSEVCRRIKEDPATAVTMVLYLAGAAASPTERAQWLQRGADALLTEPCEPEELVAAVAALVRLYNREADNRRLLQQLQRETAERRLAEVQWRDHEMRYRIIAENAHEGIWLIDSDGRTLFVNQRMADLLHRARPTMQGRSLYDFCFEEDIPAMRERVGRNLKGQSEQSDFRFRRKDGTEIVALGVTSPVPGPDDRPIGVLGMFSDITERRHAEAYLRESRERLREALDSAQMVAWEWNCTSDQVVQSENADRLLGLPTGTTVQSGHALFAMMHPDDRHHVLAAFEKAVNDHTDYAAEYRVVRPDGNVRWMTDRGRVALNEAGQVARLSGIIWDTTDLKHHQEALRSSEARFRAIYDQAAVGMCLLDPAGTLLHVNQRLCDMLGYEDSGLRGQQLQTLTFPDDREHNQTWISRLLLGGVADVSLEQRLVRRDGSPVWVSITMALLMDAGGRLEHLIGVVQDIDARKRAEAALRTSESRYRHLIQALPAAVYTCDAAGLVTLYNEAAAALWGRKPDLGKDLWCGSWRIYQPDGAPLALEHCPMAVALREGRSIRAAEIVIERPDGTRRHVLANPEPIRNGGGRVIGAVNMLVDITDRQQAEDDLRKSEARYRREFQILEAVYGGAPLGFCLVDTGLRYVRINHQLARINGVSMEAAIGRTVRDVAPSLADHLEPAYRRVIETGESILEWEFGGAAPGEPGLERSWLAKFHPLKDDEGQVVAVSTIVEDVTKQKLAEQILRDSEAYFRMMADYAPVMIWITDTAGRCTYLNKQWYEFTGQTEETGLGLGRMDAAHPEDRETARAVYREAMSERKPFSLDYRMRRADGEYRWIVDAGRPRFNERGEFLGCIGSVIDITERKEAERQLQQSHGQLERRVAERTRDLVKSQERLRALTSDLNLTEERERRRLAAELHDYLAQLLVVVRLKLGQARPHVSNAHPASLLQDCDMALDQSLTYVRTLVAQLSPPVLRTFGFPAALDWLAEQMRRYGLQVETEVSAQTPVTLTDDQAVLLFQSVRELLFNAVKHARVDRASVSLACDGPNGLRITVSDQGVGCDPSVLRDDTGTAASFGLFNIRERMEAIGGRFELHTAPNEGLRAVLALPPWAAAGEGPSPSPSANAAPETAPVKAKMAQVRRVLLVDDHAMIREGLRHILNGYDELAVVGEAGDGVEAVELARSLAPDVVVMDINLPRLDGIASTRLIKADRPATIVVGLSVHHHPYLEQQMKEAGAEGMVTKASAVDHLYQTITGAFHEVGATPN